MDVYTLYDLKPVTKPTACVLGHPIEHSKSPQIHRHWLNKHGLKGSYHALDVAPKDLHRAILLLKEYGYRGCNLTIPHKVDVLPFCDELDTAAREIGAANTIYFKDDRIIGSNTDAYGFIQNLKIQQPDYKIPSSTVCVIGAGGAARAIIYGLIQEGVPHVRIVNRTFERAHELAQDFGGKCSAYTWQSRSLTAQECGLVINTTSLGMNDQDPLMMDISGFGSKTIVADIVYVPLMTDFLKRAQLKNLKIVTGFGMLTYQAQRAFQGFFGSLPDVNAELEEILLNEKAA